jgi:hypothetical protein
MTEWSTLLTEMANAVRREVQLAPDLLADLAKLEGYIAESYHQRTFIELIQNADDADARRAYCGVRNGFVMFANDGRVFDSSDLRAICRSGASLKSGQQHKIGYRGIGFKSTINLATNIHVFSGMLTFTFSRAQSEALLGSRNVPTVRMPHPLMLSSDSGASIISEIDRLRREGFKTAFVFECADTAAASQEAISLTGEDLLFLSNLAELILDTGSETRTISLDRREAPIGKLVNLQNASESSDWLLFEYSQDKATAVAFCTNPDGIIDGSKLSPQPVHCFLPTLEMTGFGFRVTGRFSTDPSRTRIEFDESSTTALEQVTDTVLELMARVAESDPVPQNYAALFSVLDSPIGFSRIGAKLQQSLLSKARLLKWIPSSAGSAVARPEWLNTNDFSRLTSAEDAVSRAFGRLELQCPAFSKFLQSCGVPRLELRDVMQRSTEFTDVGKAEVVAQAIRELRTGNTAVLSAGFEDAALWTLDDGTITSLKEASRPLGNAIKEFLSGALTPAEITWANSQWHLDLSDGSVPAMSDVPRGTANLAGISSDSSRIRLSPDTRNLKRWRTAEQNVAALLSTQLKAQVSDVSQSNLGYDLEVAYPDGTRDYVEVKSLDRQSGDFSLTNNEYAHAAMVGDNYVLALCKVEESKISWVLVRNPVKNLDLVRRCTRWEWACSSVPSFEHSESY